MALDRRGADLLLLDQPLLFPPVSLPSVAFALSIMFAA